MALDSVRQAFNVVAAGIPIAKQLYEMVKPKKKKEKKNIFLSFKKFNESIVFKHGEGIDSTKWTEYFSRFCKRYEIPPRIEEDMIDDINIGDTDRSKERICHFKFGGGKGHILIARFAAIKRVEDDKIDFIMWYFSCDYSLNDNVIILDKEKDALDSYFYNRAVYLFEREASNGLASEYQKQTKPNKHHKNRGNKDKYNRRKGGRRRLTFREISTNYIND